MPRNLYMGIIITVFTAVIALDQITKHVVMTQMVEGQSIDIIGEFLRLVYVENPGAAFSSFSGQRLILIGFPIMVILAGGLYLLKHRSESVFLNVTLSMILAGGVGNLLIFAIHICLCSLSHSLCVFSHSGYSNPSLKQRVRATVSKIFPQLALFHLLRDRKSTRLNSSH